MKHLWSLSHREFHIHVAYIDRPTSDRLNSVSWVLKQSTASFDGPDLELELH